MNKVRLQHSFEIKRLKERGSFLVAALIMIIFLTAIGLALSALVAAQYSHTDRATYVANAELVTEAGIEKSVHQLNTDDSFPGFTTAQVFFNNSTQGKGSFTTSVSDNPDGSKTIISTGKVYRNGSSTPSITRKVKALVVGTTSGGYSVYSGPGGLILSGSANITNSDVYVNGWIDMSGASRIGSSDDPLNVNVANIACPSGNNPGPSYAELCTDGTEPISLDWSTNIYGTVCATGQVNDGPNNNIKPGNGGEGLKPGCTAPEVGRPTYDRGTQIAAVNTTKAVDDIDVNCSKWQNPNGFERTWPSNLKLVGDVNAKSSCDLTVTGDVYITGDFTIGGAAKIRVAESVGNDTPVIIVDGEISVGGSGSMVANSQDTGIKFISFKSAASCSPNCDPSVPLTGNDLKNSQDMLTVDIGGAANFPGMIFDSYWGKLKLRGSGQVGAVAGETIDLSGAGTVVFGSELSSGSQTWTISSYQRLYD